MDDQTYRLALNLIVATGMVIFTVAVHLAGLTGLVAVTRRATPNLRARDDILGQAGLIMGIVLGLFLLHSIQIWAYAVLYELIGAFGSFEAALYFSTVAFTTVGFGDLVIDSHWRLVSAIEAANGFILIGWSTAFLVSVTRQLRLLEAEIEEEIEELEDGRNARGRARRGREAR
jgi:hypothetical protein